MLNICIIDCLFPSFYRTLEGMLSQVCLSLSTSVYFYVQFAGGVVVVPQQSTDLSGITGPEATDTARGPPAKEVVNGSLSSCVNESQQCAGRFGLNKAVYPSLGFLLTGAGICTPIKYGGWFNTTYISKECWWLEAHT